MQGGKNILNISNTCNSVHLAVILHIVFVVVVCDVIIFVAVIFWQRSTKMRQGAVHSTELWGSTLYVNKQIHIIDIVDLMQHFPTGNSIM